MRIQVPAVAMGWLLAFPASARAQQEWQPFVLSQDAATLAAGAVGLETGAGYDGVAHQAGAPGASTDGLGELWIRGAVGVANRLELQGIAVMTGLGAHGSTFDQGRVEVRGAILDHPGGTPIQVTLAGGWQVDYLHANAIEGSATVTARPGRLLLTTNLQAAHYFVSGRDGVDLSLSTGALYRLLQGVDVGAEYLAEELEGVLGGSDADIGPGGRQWVGPSAGAQVPGTNLRLKISGGRVWTAGEAGAFVRASAGYVF